MSVKGWSGMGKGSTPKLIRVAGIPIADSSRAEVVRMASCPAVDRARLIFALHVGGLLLLADSDFMAAMRGADLVYADGAAVVLLGRVSGARLERAPTTDIGLSVISELAVRLTRPVRAALVGGPPGLAEKARGALEDHGQVEVVMCADGFFEDDAALIARLHDCAPDLVILGLGMPREAVWSFSQRDRLPPAVVLTCGGWFGFLAGEERRAPRVLRAAGLEWTYRLGQHFPRLIGRYSRGVVAVARLIPGQLRLRREGSH